MFPVTQWSRVVALRDEDEGVRWRALCDLLEIYRPALVRCLQVSEGMPMDRAEDLVHSFIENRILLGRMLEKADVARGRLRSFLLRSLRNFIASERRRECAAKRMPAAGAPVALDHVVESDLATVPDIDAYDAVWARQTLALAVGRFHDECLRASRTDWWDVFEARVLAPTFGEGEAYPYDELARRHGFGKPQDAANTLVSAKRAFGRCLRSFVAETVTDPDMVDEEIKNLCTAVSREQGALR